MLEEFKALDELMENYQTKIGMKLVGIGRASVLDNSPL
jgi:hypothetical protein